MDEQRNSRNEALFGKEGQARIAATSATVAGLGGLGAHVCQQLAYLGITVFALYDHDHVSTSSLNRLVGAVPSDAAEKTPKVDVARRMIQAIQPSATVQVSQLRVGVDAKASDVIRGAHVVFGCFDRETPRLQMTDACADDGVTYIDLATDTGPTDAGVTWYGGRVVVADGRRCLSCLGLLDQEELRREQMTPDELCAHEAIYGVPVGALQETGPSVVSLNGIIASIAVTEFMVMVTGLRLPTSSQTYRADLGRLTRSNDAPKSSCFYCETMKRAAGRLMPRVP